MIKLLITEIELSDFAEVPDDLEFNDRFGRRLMTVRMHGLVVPNSEIAAVLRISAVTLPTTSSFTGTKASPDP